MSDNWKTDGNCRECRRQDYCSKPRARHSKKL